MRGLADAVEHHEAQQVPAGLLVPAHPVEQGLPAVPAVGGGQAQGLEDGQVAVGDGVGGPAHAAAQLGGEGHADGHRGAVAHRVAFRQFDGVGQGVAVVQEFALARLAQVVGDDLGLDGDGALDEFAQARRAWHPWRRPGLPR